MCTATWIKTAQGYELLFNRDELRARQRALPPRIHRDGSIRYLAPRDGEAGGTWIAVNDHAVAACLLNGEVASPPAGGSWQSRGEIIRALAPATGREALLARLGTLDLERYRPFVLLALDATGEARAAGWDGRGLTLSDGEPELPVTSSSFDAEGAHRSRRDELGRYLTRAGGLSPEALLAFHRSHAPECGPYSACMHRADALTVSFSRVRVGAEAVDLAYADGPPCFTPLGAPLVLDRQDVCVADAAVS